MAITGFVGEYEFLSNAYHHEFEFDGITFTNAEAAFQSTKTENRTSKKKLA